MGNEKSKKIPKPDKSLFHLEIFGRYDKHYDVYDIDEDSGEYLYNELWW